VGYFVENSFKGVGTLYRISMNGRENEVSQFFPAFINSGPSGPLSRTVHRVSDGIVNFQINAVFPVSDAFSTNFISTNVFQFMANDLPAYVDLEFGVVEPTTLKQMESLLSDPGIDQKVVEHFLTNQLGRIHYFRQRVPIRNFLNPYRSNEVP
jgi:hypothetical protein